MPANRTGRYTEIGAAVRRLLPNEWLTIDLPDKKKRASIASMLTDIKKTSSMDYSMRCSKEANTLTIFRNA